MKYKCQICGYVYDDEKEKVPFAELPDTWKCPLCGAPKSAFAPEEVIEQTKPAPVTKDAVQATEAESLTSDFELTSGQLAAICSNLARGCEKQYMTEEAELYRELANYLSSITPAVNDASVEMVEASLSEDIADYPKIREVVDHDKDRGAARALTWGEKVSRMLSALVERYLNEGESMLEGQNVYLCTACGFVYVGEDAPDLCPVCKVPSWKFEKVEGRA